MIPDFPQNIRIRLPKLNFFLLHPDVALSLLCWLSQFSFFSKLRQPTGQRLSNVRTQQKKNSIWPILFLYYEESLVSSNLNSKLIRFPEGLENTPFNQTNPILILWGKSGIIKYEFKPTLVSLCSSWFKYNQNLANIFWHFWITLMSIRVSTMKPK